MRTTEKTKKRRKLPFSLRHEYRMNDTGDPYGRVMGWRFALADYMTHRGIAIPSEWEFRQAHGGPCRDAYEFRELSRRNDKASTLQHFGRVLFRLDQIIRATGRDY